MQISFDCENCQSPVEPDVDDNFLVYESETTCECGAHYILQIDNRGETSVRHTFWNPEDFEE